MGRGRWWGRWLGPVAGAVVLSLAVVSVLLLMDLRRTASDLAAAREQLRAVPAAVADGDLGHAARQLDIAASSLAPARARVDSPARRLLARVPALGDALRAVGDITETAASGVDLATMLLDPLADLQDGLGDGGVVPLAPFDELTAVLRSPDRERFIASRTRLVATGGALRPASLGEAREEVLDASAELGRLLESLDDIAEVVPALLGADGPQRYLLAMQNSAELRGTGGLIGFHAVLEADRGHLSMSTPQTDESVRTDPARVPLGPEQEEWLGHLRPTASLKNVNLDPDFTRTGRLIAGVYEASTGVTLDGVIAVDPTGLAALLGPDGWLEVPAEVAQPEDGLARRVSAADLPRLLLVDAYAVLGGGTPERKAYHAAVAKAAMARLVDLDGRDADVLERLGFMVEGRHLQIHSRDPRVQSGLERLGVAGRLGGAAGADLLALTVNNAGAGKPDVHVRHGLTATVILTPDEGTGRAHGRMSGQRLATVEAAVSNELTRDGTGVVRASTEGAPTVRVTGADNRSWLTFWGPADARVLRGDSSTGPMTASVGAVGDHVRVDHLLVVPPGGRRTAAVTWAGPVTMEREQEGTVVYRVTLWRQAKAVADHWTLELSGGPGWSVADVSAHGRTDAERLGFDEREEPVDVEVSDGLATVTGTTVGDLHVTVRLAPRGGQAAGSG